MGKALQPHQAGRILVPMRTFLLGLLLGGALLLPTAAFAADTNFFGEIYPTACKCDTATIGYESAPAFGCVMKVIQNIINLGLSIGVALFVIIASYAGFLFMTSSMNPRNREMGRSVLLNAVVGLIIALSAWLLVDFVMKAVYNPDANFNGSRIGPWNEILVGDGTPQSTCIPKANQGQLGSYGSASDSTSTDGVTGSGANCPPGDPASMVSFPSEATSGGAEKATQTTVNNFMAMRAAAAEADIDLKVTDGFRSDAEQVALWNQYCSSGRCAGIQVAKPCSLGGPGSNHNSGEAVDIDVGCRNGQSGCDTAAYRWLKQNGSRWSFTNNLATDPLHWSPNGR